MDTVNKFLYGFQDTRKNSEDFALTPFLLLVYVNQDKCKIRGIGICWGYSSVFLAFGFNIPKNY
jgi:hypothetical protein